MNYYDVDWQQIPVAFGLIAAVLIIIAVGYAISWIVDWLTRDAY